MIKKCSIKDFKKYLQSIKAYRHLIENPGSEFIVLELFLMDFYKMRTYGSYFQDSNFKVDYFKYSTIDSIKKRHQQLKEYFEKKVEGSIEYTDKRTRGNEEIENFQILTRRKAFESFWQSLSTIEEKINKILSGKLENDESVQWKDFSLKKRDHPSSDPDIIKYEIMDGHSMPMKDEERIKYQIHFETYDKTESLLGKLIDTTSEWKFNGKVIISTNSYGSREE